MELGKFFFGILVCMVCIKLFTVLDDVNFDSVVKRINGETIESTKWTFDRSCVWRPDGTMVYTFADSLEYAGFIGQLEEWGERQADHGE